MLWKEWQLRISQSDYGRLVAVLYETDQDGQWTMLADQEFGPFDTALDVLQWATRHWAPRAKRAMG